VLVVDDEADIREGLEMLLTSEGYAVDLAQNGTEGLRKMEISGYDLVLLDLMMPDRSGMDVLQEVRQRDRETPIFMITAYGSVEAAVSALKLGANDYFSKPWDNEKLIIEIDRMIAAAAARIREHPAQARPQAALQLPQHHRQERAHGAHAGPGGAGGAQPLHHPDHRRDRHRQGTGRQGHPRQLAARRPDVRRREQRLAAAGLCWNRRSSGT
jgi:DNA-binding response OmpR family regulator